MMDWNSEISNDGSVESILLPEGEYNFKVVKFEQAVHEESERIPKCLQANLTLEIKTEQGTSFINEKLFLTESMEWKLCQFFTCIGQRTHGQKYQMDWTKVLGATGRAHVVPNEYIGNDGVAHQNNKVKKYLEKKDDDPMGLPFAF